MLYPAATSSGRRSTITSNAKRSSAMAIRKPSGR
jgi:hypothetical protein